jgi:phosphate starvation-inducible PhoH-like protein
MPKKSVPIQSEVPTSKLPKIKFKTFNQKRFYRAIEHDSHRIILAHALAGAGKTFISLYKGLEMLYDVNSSINSIVIINPTVDVANEDKLGHLPGDLMSKIMVHNDSAYFILEKIIGKVALTKLIETNVIQFRVLNFLRGVNFERTYIVLDEAQNASSLQLKTLLTRISDDSKLVIQGDLSQCDKFKTNGTVGYTKSGFYDIWKRFAHVFGVCQIEFTKEDCIRSGIVKRVLEKYEDDFNLELGEQNYYNMVDID